MHAILPRVPINVNFTRRNTTHHLTKSVVMLSEALQRNAKHGARLSSISGLSQNAQRIATEKK